MTFAVFYHRADLEHIRVGYYAGDSAERRADGLPNPRHSTAGLTPAQTKAVVSYLRSGEGLVHAGMREDCVCYICGASLPDKEHKATTSPRGRMGAAHQTDGAFLWPAGLAHYVEKHDVELPHEMIERALRVAAGTAGVVGWVAAPRGQATRVTALDKVVHWQAKAWASNTDNLREQCILALELAGLDVEGALDAVLVDGCKDGPPIELGLRLPLLDAGPRPAAKEHAGDPMTWERIPDKTTIDVRTLGLVGGTS